MNIYENFLFIFIYRFQKPAQAWQGEKVVEAEMLLNCLHPNERKLNKDCDEIIMLILSQI